LWTMGCSNGYLSNSINSKSSVCLPFYAFDKLWGLC
jgi:hypothetical protein